MPVKWKIFTGLNITQFILASVLYIALSIGFFSSESNVNSGTDWLVFFIISFCFLIIAANNLLNFYILRKFFPDAEINRTTRILHNIVTFFNAVFLFILLLIFVYIITVEMPSNDDDTGFVVFCYFLLFFLLTGITLLVIQFDLKSSITKACHRKIKETIQQIGEDNTVN